MAVAAEDDIGRQNSNSSVFFEWDMWVCPQAQTTSKRVPQSYASVSPSLFIISITMQKMWNESFIYTQPFSLSFFSFFLPSFEYMWNSIVNTPFSVSFFFLFTFVRVHCGTQ